MVIFVTKNGHRFHMTARQWQWRPVINNRIKLYTHCSTHPPLYIYSFSPSTVFNMQYPIYPIEYEPSLRPTFLHDFSPKISFTRGGGVDCRKKIFLKTFSRNRGIPINNLPYKNYKTIPIITDRYPQQSLEARVPKERREGAKFAEHTNLSLILKQGKGVGSRARSSSSSSSWRGRKPTHESCRGHPPSGKGEQEEEERNRGGWRWNEEPMDKTRLEHLWRGVVRWRGGGGGRILTAQSQGPF